MLLFVSLQNGELKQITFLFLLLTLLLEWILLVPPTLMYLSFLPWVYELQSTSESTIFKGVITCLTVFFFFQYILHDNSQFILWFTPLGICFNIDLGYLKLTFI